MGFTKKILSDEPIRQALTQLELEQIAINDRNTTVEMVKATFDKDHVRFLHQLEVAEQKALIDEKIKEARAMKIPKLQKMRLIREYRKRRGNI